MSLQETLNKEALHHFRYQAGVAFINSSRNYPDLHKAIDALSVSQWNALLEDTIAEFTRMQKRSEDSWQDWLLMRKALAAIKGLMGDKK